VPGYNKLNQYRVLGDILRFADNIGPGQLRFGVCSKARPPTATTIWKI